MERALLIEVHECLTALHGWMLRRTSPNETLPLLTRSHYALQAFGAALAKDDEEQDEEGRYECTGCFLPMSSLREEWGGRCSKCSLEAEMDRETGSVL